MGQTIAAQLFPSQKSSNLTELLVVVVICTVLMWSLQFLWKRRKLYQTSIRLPGPFALPLVGCAYYFIGKPSVFKMGQTIAAQLFPSQKSSNLTELLVVVVICTVLMWSLQFLWKRRKLYQTSIRLPGPFALPLVGCAYYFIGKPSDTYEQIDRMFHKYPNIFRVWFGPRLFYAISNPRYFEIILMSPHALKKENLYRMAEPVVGLGLFTAPVPKWKKHRKIIMPTFNQKILGQFSDIFVEQSEILVQVMEKFAGKGEVDIFNLMTRCTLDIICETAMGVQIKAQSTDSIVPKWIDRIMEIVMMRIFNIFYHIDFIFNHSPLGKDFHTVNNKLRSFTMKVVTDKRAQYEKKLKINAEKYIIEEETPKRKAFLDLLIEMNYKEGNHHFTDEELMDETITLIIAGTDTTASTNCFALTMLGIYPDIQDKVMEEIMEVVGPERKVKLSDLPRLKYLERVIKETLRLYPIAPIIVRAVEQDIDLGEYVVQKGSSVVIGILRTHMDERYWPDPYKFDPDRFLPEEIAKRTPGCYIPFSFGPRNCIGMKYAMMAMKPVLATVLRKYRIYTTYKSVEDIELKTNLVLRPKHGYKVSLEPRT